MLCNLIPRCVCFIFTYVVSAGAVTAQNFLPMEKKAVPTMYQMKATRDHNA